MEGSMSTLLRDAIKKAGEPLAEGDTARGGFAQLAREAQEASRLRQQCARVLRRSDKDSWQRRLSAGRLDRRAYGRLASGDHSNPYARHTFSPGYETEIIILLDGSDSMSQRLQASTRREPRARRGASRRASRGQVRDRALLWPQGPFAQSAARALGSPNVQARLAFASMSTHGSTPLTQSLALCAKRLTVRAPTKRKNDFCGDGRDLRHGAKRRQAHNRALRQCGRGSYRIVDR